MNAEKQIIDYLLSNIIFTVNEIQPEQQLIESLLIDSISIIKVILFLEKQFDIRIEDEDLDPNNFETVKNMVNLVNKKRNERCIVF